MALNSSAVLQSPFRSIGRAVLTSANTAAEEAVTHDHKLGACPSEIRGLLRSTITTPSGVIHAAVLSWNASQVLINMGAQPLGIAQATWDIVCERRPAGD